MSETVKPYLWLIPALPLLSAVVTAFLGPRVLKRNSHWPTVLAIPAACVLSVMALMAVAGQHDDHGHSSPVGIAVYYPWIQAGTSGVSLDTHAVDVGLSLRADALSTQMLVMITFIASFIAIYSVGYMHGDPGYPRFFAAVSLFVASMTLLVLGDNFIVMFAGWEGVGLCSYLLIGFWFTKPEAAAAARKAFLVTRIGDVGLMLGILVLWLTYGSVDFATVFAGVEADAAAGRNANMLFAAAMLLFCGAAGKSAQFPLHVWLPDAMEGPTPVSALIHAATMVTAGVYLLARSTVLFAASPTAQVIVACIGGFTALFAALIALTQNDLKRVLAYSTLSQLGYMFLALGCAVQFGRDRDVVSFAVTAAMFHLFTHAFFKALLFLGAGSVMHSMGHVIDMRRFSGLRQVMPHTHWTFLVGSLALAGFPLLSGFWSKDEILVSALKASESPTYGRIYFVLLVAAMVTAFLTAFYTFRAYFKTFWGKLVVPAEAYHHHAHGDDHGDGHGHADHGHGGHGHGDPHATKTAAPAPAHAPASHGTGHGEKQLESPAVMTIPLMVLAVFAAFVGIALGPTHQFAHHIEKTPGIGGMEAKAHLDFVMMAVSSVIAVAGIALAYLFYVVAPAVPAAIAKASPALYQLSLNKFYIDEIYGALVVKPLGALAGLFRKADSDGVDGTVDFVGHLPGLLGELFRPLQNGLVQFYALATVLGLVVFLLSMLIKA